MRIAPETWRMIAAEMKNEKRPAAVVQRYAEKLGLSANTIYRMVKRHGGWESGRKTRRDAFCLSEEEQRHMYNIAYLLHQKASPHGRESKTGIPTALEIYRDHLHAAGEAEVSLPSPSTVARWLRRCGLSRRQVQAPTPKRSLRSLHPNHVHELDFSICRYYLAADNRIVYISRRDENRNKPDRFLRAVRLCRAVLVDHYSGAFFVQYSFTQQSLDVAEFLYRAWEDKGEYIFHGVPQILLMDNDRALRSHALLRLLHYLQVEVPAVAPYAPWVKGAVEVFMNIWETQFESRFLFRSGVPGEDNVQELQRINRAAFEYALRFHRQKIHNRHKKTRFACWDEGIAGHLREVPDYPLYQRLLHSTPECRRVGADGSFRYNGRRYRLPDSDLRNTHVDVCVHPYLHHRDFTVTVQYPSRLHGNPDDIAPAAVRTLQLLPERTLAGGFSENAVVFGQYRGLPAGQTQIQMQRAAAAPLTRENLSVFGGHAERAADVSFAPRRGTPCAAITDIHIGKTIYSKIKAKLRLSQTLGRALDQWESEYLDREFGAVVSEAQIEEALLHFRRRLDQQVLHEAGA